MNVLFASSKSPSTSKRAPGNSNSNLISRKGHMDTSLKLENDETGNHTSISPQDCQQDTVASEKIKMRGLTRQRDRIRLMFKKSHQSNADSIDISNNEHSDVLAKALSSMQQDVQEALIGSNQMDGQTRYDGLLHRFEHPITAVNHRPLRECHESTAEVPRSTYALDPDNSFNSDANQSSYPYTDAIKPNNYNLVQVIKQAPLENLLVHHKPFQHKQLRYRTQHRLSSFRRDLNKFKHGLRQERSIKSQEALIFSGAETYQSRLEKNLCELRRQMADYSLVDHTTMVSSCSIDLTGNDIKTTNAIKESPKQDDQPISISYHFGRKKQKHQLESAPYIAHREHYVIEPTATNTFAYAYRSDQRFDFLIVPDLNKEAEHFFSSDAPFWDRSFLSMDRFKNFNRLNVPNKLEYRTNPSSSREAKYSSMQDLEHKPSDHCQVDSTDPISSDMDKFFDCASSLSQEAMFRSESFLRSMPSFSSSKDFDNTTF